MVLLITAQVWRTSHQCDRPLRGRAPPRVLSPPARPHSNLRQTCLVEVDGEPREGLCDPPISQDMSVHTATERGLSPRVQKRSIAFLTNHLLYCTVVRQTTTATARFTNTTKMLGVEPPEFAIQDQTLRKFDYTNSVYIPVRSRPMHFMRARCVEGLPESRSERKLCPFVGRIPIREFCGMAAAAIGESSCVFLRALA